MSVLCITILSYVFPVCLKAQFPGTLIARPDNVFVDPNSRGAVFNILLNDDYGTCGSGSLNISIFEPPTQAQSCVVNAANQINYRPKPGYAGKDSLIYQITCGDRVSTAKVYINICNKPDNVYTDVCHITPPTFVWGISSPQVLSDVMVQAIPLTGDVDGDGFTDIVIQSHWNAADVRSRGFTVFKGPDFTTIFRNDLGRNFSSSSMGMAKVKWDAAQDSVVIILYSDTDGKLYAYNYQGQTLWSSSTAIPNSLIRVGSAINFADFNRDGYTEVYIGNQIFDAVTGLELCNGGSNNYGHVLYSNPADGIFSIAYDVWGDSRPELCAGNQVYEVQINSRTNPALNSMNVIKQVFPENSSGETLHNDGATVVADFDNDGELEILVQTQATATAVGSTGYLYIWKPSTQTILTVKELSNANARSVPFVGDINGDGKVEIVLLTSSVNPTPSLNINKLTAYSLSGGTLNFLWDLDHSDNSGSTGITLFDFNQDGIAEIVYRDETQLRVINGSLKSHVTGRDTTAVYNLFSTPCYSGTTYEYSTVADVDNDGHAEILATSNYPADSLRRSNILNGELRIYRGEPSLWAFSRSVWNQYGFNPVAVNNDLTIPQYPLSPAAVFETSDGSGENRPYNNFLQQGTSLNDEGEMLYLGPDLMFDLSQRTEMKFDPASGAMNVTIYLYNDGDADFPGPIRVGTYVYNSVTDQYTIVYLTNVDETVAVNESKTITYSIPNYLTITAGLPAYDYWYICVNAKDNPTVTGGKPEYYYTRPGETKPFQEECNSWNNYTSNVAFSYGEHVMCESRCGDRSCMEWLKLTPKETYQYRWTRAGESSPFYTGDSLLVSKNSSPMEYYLIDVYTLDGLIKVTTVPDTAKLYLAPDSLIWTGSGNNKNWHDPANWYNPDISGMNPYPQANIPRKCTDVLIPDSLSIYPDLDPLETDYAEYRSECADITFEHGGEVCRTDSLDYDAAYVHLTLNANRYYMLSAPLRSFYPGDYYATNPNPFKDNYGDSLFVYTYLFSRVNPETSDYVEGDWTGAFNNPEYKFSPGMGYCVWVDDMKPLTDHDPVNFFFPKRDETYTMYDRDGNPVGIRNTPRRDDPAIPQENYFIYEPVLNKTTGIITLDAASTAPGKKVIVGNPFMSHLDFEKLYSMNSDKIKRYYQVLDETYGNFITYDPSGLSTDSHGSGNPPLNQYIAPMQSVLVESKAAFGELYADVTMTTNRPDEKLRSSESIAPEVLTIDVYDGDLKNRALVVHNPQADNFYDDFDATKIFLRNVSEPVQVFTESADGIMLDINHVADFDHPIPIGFHTSGQGKYTLYFSGQWDFARDYDIFLNEVSPDGEVKQTDLRTQSWYNVEKTTSDIFLKDRFFLSFKQIPAGITNPEIRQAPIEWVNLSGKLRIFTTDGSLLQNVVLYDISGQMIAAQNPVRSSSTEFTVKRNGFYVVRATGDSGAASFKIYVR